MTERSAEQAPVHTRPDPQENTARIPLAERLQRRISAAADERRTSTQAPRESARVLPPPTEQAAAQQNGRVLPPPPPEQVAAAQQAREDAQREAELARAQAQQAERTQRQSSPVPAPTPAATQTGTVRRTPPRQTVARGPRRARLRLSRIDPWSVMKVSFLLAIAFGIVTVVSVFMVWSVLGAAGVWSSINHTVSDTVSSGNTTSTFNIENYLGMSRVLGFTMLVSVIDVILITAIATLSAFLYNMAASLLGGIEVTLAEDQF